MNFLNLFKPKISDRIIFEKLGEDSYIRNGVGYGFISDDLLYDDALLEIGFGRITSGYGDWGGGFDHTSDSPLKITIDKNYIIKKVSTHSFYNSKESMKIEKISKKIKDRLKIRDKFIIEEPFMKKSIQSLLDFIPARNHIGWDVFRSPHMLEFFMEDKDYYKNRIRESKYLEK